MGYIPKAHIAERFVADPRTIVETGQTLLCEVVDVAEDGRLSLTLKHSHDDVLTSAHLQRTLWRDMDVVYEVENEGKAWADELAVGSSVTCHVSGIKEYGIVCEVEGDADVVGLISPDHAPSPPASLSVGDALEATIIDVDKAGGYVDLSTRGPFTMLAPEAVPRRRAKRGSKRRDGREEVGAIVQLAKPEYVMVTVPAWNHALASVCVKTINDQKGSLSDAFEYMQPITCTLVTPPSQGKEGKGGKGGKEAGDGAASGHGGRIVLHAAAPASLSVPSQGRGGRDRRGGQAGKYEVGSWVVGAVDAIEPMQIFLLLGDGGGREDRCRLHITEVAENKNAPTPTFGSEMRVRVLGVHMGEDGRARHLEVSTREDTTLEEVGGDVDVNGRALAQGASVVGFVQAVQDDYVWVVLSRAVRGRMHVLESSADPAELARFRERFQPGDRIACTIVRRDKARKIVDLSMRSDGTAALTAGDACDGLVTAVTPLHATVQLRGGVFGRVFVTDVAGGDLERGMSRIAAGSIVRCTVLASSSHDGKRRIDLAVSVGDGPAAPCAACASASDVAAGEEVAGYVKSVGPKGCFVSLSRSLDARVKLRNLSSSFVKNPAKAFPKGAWVKGRVLEVHADRNQVEATLKAGPHGGGGGGMGGLAEGDVREGTITRLEKYGAFCRLKDPSGAQHGISGLVHISEVSDAFVTAVHRVLSVGDAVRVRVIRLDDQTGRVYFSMKGDGGLGPIAPSSEAEGGPGGMDDGKDVDGDAVMEEEPLVYELPQPGVHAIDTDSDEEDLGRRRAMLQGMRNPLQGVPVVVAPAPAPVAPESAAGAPDADDDDAVEEDAAAAAAAAVPAPAAAKGGPRVREADVRAAELLRVSGDAAPATASDFERLVLVSPNDALAWIRYMAHLLSLGQADEARKVAERALERIDYRAQDAKRDVWVAYINLEFEHGRPDADQAAMALFHRALPFNNPLKLYQALLTILRAKQKHDLTKEVLGAMTRKFRAHPEVWQAAIAHHVAAGQDRAASGVLDRALKSLERRDHIPLVSHAALLHYRAGMREQGRHMFESILKSYPKRTDLWGVYLDQEMKQVREREGGGGEGGEGGEGGGGGEEGGGGGGGRDRVLHIFERVTALDIPPKRMKAIFMKWMAFVEGDEAQVQAVKSKAMAYVEAKMG